MKSAARGCHPDTATRRMLELARGTGPCRCCLAPFAVGRDARLLFTYRPAGHDGSLMAPGPVFIHAEHCQAYAGPGFPDGLRSLPLAFEARASGSRVIELAASRDSSPEAQIERLFESAGAEWIHLRTRRGGLLHRAHRSRVSKKSPRGFPRGPSLVQRDFQIFSAEAESPLNRAWRRPCWRRGRRT